MKTVLLSFENQIATITLSRPEALNALNADLLAELEQTVAELRARAKQGEVRVVIVTGAGEKAFVAGADIKEIHQLQGPASLEFARKGQKIFRDLETLPVPVIAAVNGFALGGGLELALSCDFIYAAENAKLGLPEVSLGLIPGFGGTVRLSRVVGQARAQEMILSGAPITAQEAQQCGLVNRVVPLAELLNEVKKTATLMASRGPLALAAAKKCVQQTSTLSVDSGLSVEAEQFSALFSSSDVFEGTRAFIEKRKPVFTGAKGQ